MNLEQGALPDTQSKSVKLLQTLGAALKLLPQGGRRKYIWLVALQICLGILDLLGILLIGLVALLATSFGLSVGFGSSVVDRLTALPLFSGWTQVAITIAVALVAVGFFLVKSVASAFLTRRIFVVLAQGQTAVSIGIFGRIVQGNLNTVRSSPTVSIAYALTSGVAAAVVEFLGAMGSFFSETALIIVLSVTVLLIDPFTSICALTLFAALALYLHFGLAKYSRKIGSDMSRSSMNSYVSIQEGISAYRELAVAGRLPNLLTNMEHSFKTLSDAQARMSFVGNVPKYAFEVALMLGAAIIGVVLFAFKSPEAAIASLAIFLAVASRLMPALLRMQSSLIIARIASSRSNSLFEMIDRLERAGVDLQNRETPDTDCQNASHGNLGYIRVENLSIGYHGDSRLAVESVSLELPPGTSLAVVGPTGAGKTSLIDGILGLLPPQTGRVEIDGMSVESKLRKAPGFIAYVPQDALLVNSTVRSNVALGVPDDQIDDELVLAALEKAHLLSHIESLPLGVNQPVGERGTKLSGGQRQRLGLARAFYTQPKILILDEATSALDAGTEDLVSGTIKALAGEVSTITIAHRLSTVRNCDQILYLQMGKAIALGSFEEVRHRVPEFDNQARLMGL